MDQAEHMRRLRWSKVLKETPQAHHLALALHLQMGSKHGKRFGETPLNVSAVLLSKLTGMSERTVKRHIPLLVESGFYRRVDTGKGGYSGKASAAAWLPTLPDFE
ncbi:helix-turn-helix domain-containing protein [Saccharothrix syringae]|uniref:Helix-turn-helix domain-containing protein n=1 Tax=Saccharothrix syringae TaxID=103733 RepID=A0A5Q0HC04_SACSY|nr:hypothetical protein [Saccharothrix syringae]QFZ23340.1 hypothetical protein EKG83_43165 [Saccharothrix syringae]